VSRALPLVNWARVNHQTIMYKVGQKSFCGQENLTNALFDKIMNLYKKQCMLFLPQNESLCLAT